MPNTIPFRKTALLLLGLSATAAGCATVSRSSHVRASADDFDGNFTLRGEWVDKPGACRGVVLAAHHLFIDTRGGTAFADVVERTYALHIDGGSLSAEGDFPEPAGCPPMHERWDLAVVDGGLEGTLSSRWHVPGNCSANCDVLFKVGARRLQAPTAVP